MHVHDSSNLSVITLCSRSRCGAREAMTAGCKPTSTKSEKWESAARAAQARTVRISREHLFRLNAVFMSHARLRPKYKYDVYVLNAPLHLVSGAFYFWLWQSTCRGPHCARVADQAGQRLTGDARLASISNFFRNLPCRVQLRLKCVNALIRSDF